MADLTSRSNITKKDALDFHKNDKPGKLSIAPSKPLSTARDLSLAYSPGVAYPCLEIKENEAPKKSTKQIEKKSLHRI